MNFARSTKESRALLRATGSMASKDIERQDFDRNMKLTPSERFELVFELSALLAEVKIGHTNRRSKIRKSTFRAHKG